MGVVKAKALGNKCTCTVVRMAKEIRKDVNSQEDAAKAKYIQWNPSITDTFGDQHFVRYSKVSSTQGLPVYFR